jgi:membrane-associated protease RseP (regulator of RpoE activity)
VNLGKGESLGINVHDAAAGLRIAAVEAGGAGEAAGLRVGDFITHIDGEPVKSRQNFIAAIRKVSLGKRKQVTVSIRCGLEVISLAVGSKVIAPEPETTTVERERKKGPDPQILDVQRCLRRVGFDPGPADGLWGQKTAEAVREFQKWYPHQKLTITGKLDEQTYAALLKADTQGLRRDAYKKSSLEPSAAKKRDEAEVRQKEEERRAEQRRKAEEQRRAEEKRKEEERRQQETDKIIEKGKKIFRDIFKF